MFTFDLKVVCVHVVSVCVCFLSGMYRPRHRWTSRYGATMQLRQTLC